MKDFVGGTFGSGRAEAIFFLDSVRREATHPEMWPFFVMHHFAGIGAAGGCRLAEEAKVSNTDDDGRVVF